MKALRKILLATLALGALSGCNDHVEVAIATVQPTATPVPKQDVLAFTRNGQLWVMRYDGSDTRLLARDARSSFWFPSPSPKASRRPPHFLAWRSTQDGSQNVVRIYLDGRIEALTDIGERADPEMKNARLGSAPVYDSKGERIIYSFNGNVWIMNADGENSRTLIHDGASYSPVFSPDDSRIAYVNGHRGDYDLWIMDLSSRDTFQVTDFASQSVGQPRWWAEGKRILLTRSQKDESNVVSVLADVEQPVADAEVVTRDNMSASAILAPDAVHLLFSSARENYPSWDIWISDIKGNEAKILTTGGGLSPAWMAMPIESEKLSKLPPAPTPIARATQIAVASQPSLLPTQASLQATPVIASTQASPQPVATQAGSVSQPTPAAQATLATGQAALSPVATSQAGTAQANTKTTVAGLTPQVSPGPAARPTPPSQALGVRAAPTQPPSKAPPLRLRLRASFDPDNDELATASLVELRKLAGRVQQYDGQSIQIFGPRDGSSLRGRYPSDEERSLERAQKVAAALSTEASLKGKAIQALPYAPVALGSSGPANGIQILVELK